MAAIGNLRHRPARRLGQLYAGLVLYGVSMALMVRSGLGLNPWDVFHQGLSRQTGISIGTASILVGAAVLLLWIPLRQRPGLGTVSNVLVIGLVVDATLALLPAGHGLPVRIGLLTLGIVANGAATALYLGAALGPGPRDGLMTGYVARRPGRSVRLVRTVIEVIVLSLGWLLGGNGGPRHPRVRAGHRSARAALHPALRAARAAGPGARAGTGGGLRRASGRRGRLTAGPGTLRHRPASRAPRDGIICTALSCDDVHGRNRVFSPG